MKPSIAPIIVACMIAASSCDDHASKSSSAPISVAVSAIVLPAAPAVVPTPAASAAQPQPPDRIAAQHLLVAYRGAKGAPKGTVRSKADALKRAQEAAKRAKAGEDFSALVKEYSDDATKENQGNLGMFNRKSKVKAFADAAFSLGVGATSDPVETEFGFHVIKRNQ